MYQLNKIIKMIIKDSYYENFQMFLILDALADGAVKMGLPRKLVRFIKSIL